jgi:hypothetical protein
MPPFDWEHFATQHASAIFGLVGAFGGGVLSFVATYMMKKREFNLQMSGKLIERRIKAHEQVIALAIEMRVMVMLGGVDVDGEVRRAPQVLLSKEEFENWFTRFTQLSLEGTTWLTPTAKRELNLVQDYLVTLHQHLVAVPSESYSVVGEHVRADFIDLSSSLEKKAYEFFETGIRKLRLDSLNHWHKYKRPVTERRLLATALLRNRDQIEMAVHLDASAR